MYRPTISVGNGILPSKLQQQYYFIHRQVNRLLKYVRYTNLHFYIQCVSVYPLKQRQEYVCNYLYDGSKLYTSVGILTKPLLFYIIIPDVVWCIFYI